MNLRTTIALASLASMALLTGGCDLLTRDTKDENTTHITSSTVVPSTTSVFPTVAAAATYRDPDALFSISLPVGWSDHRYVDEASGVVLTDFATTLNAVTTAIALRDADLVSTDESNLANCRGILDEWLAPGWTEERVDKMLDGSMRVTFNGNNGASIGGNAFCGAGPTTEYMVAWYNASGLATDSLTRIVSSFRPA